MTDVPIPGMTKLFPRNLTARAAIKVRGNPVSARPESGVENTHPGLEYDQRNMDRFFFPGLAVEFQFLDGARVTGIDPALLPAGPALRPEDAGTDLRLLYVIGRCGAAPAEPRVWELNGLDGYDVLRCVRDLEPGPLLVVIGRIVPVTDPHVAGALMHAFGALTDRDKGPPAPTAIRAPDGTLLFAILTGERARFLTTNGVIDTTLIGAGELTRSLCAPWQWDFADCGCHYWASSRPDIVIGAKDGGQTLNFQRDRANAAPPTPAKTYEEWTKGQITQQGMVTAWTSLSVVVAETETDRALAPTPQTPRNLLDLDGIVERLQKLATIEHALSIVYLYAHYSLDAPRILPPGADQALTDRHNAANQLYLNAVEEMRHFRWANEALLLLGAPRAFGRADTVTIQIKEQNVDLPATLQPLNPGFLDFLIAIEAPSKHPTDPEIDGMYWDILLSLPSLPGIDPRTIERVREVVKLIIDEGHNHWERLCIVRTKLAGQPPAQWCRIGPPAPASGELRHLQHLADLYYETLLAGIVEAFDQNLAQRAEIIEQAHRAMKNLHEIAHHLAAHGVGPLFTTPILPDTAVDAATDRIAGLHRPLATALAPLQGSTTPGLPELAVRHAAEVAKMVAGMHGAATPPG